eukprot:gnl/TRDRNA2_/TRDRNA2_182394_c0_seq1.p1 gnl/TRDRNA2_/TRDRNA2_182394_c0~~gnl/TRDRNA2_/TRDRNA2_182394_c0_seq1.p1  ORF type:complete len:582 (-),score=133.32 gnl/TRDRNA2_/TRDRNA2_182394_c0_seq1:156-1901(-)
MGYMEISSLMDGGMSPYGGSVSKTHQSTKQALELFSPGAGMIFHRYMVYSSTSSILGLSRSSDYAASNSWLDEFIAHRRAMSTHGTGMNWGMVSGTGLAGGPGYPNQKPAPMKPKPFNSSAPKDRDELSWALSLTGSSVDMLDDIFKKIFSKEPINILKSYQYFVQVAFKSVESSVELQNIDAFGVVNNLKVAVKDTTASDKVLLVCNLPIPSDQNCEESEWAIKCGSREVTTWSYKGGATLVGSSVAWVDSPGAQKEAEYTANCSIKGFARLDSPQQLAAIKVPGEETKLANSDEVITAKIGEWQDVPGLVQGVQTKKGDKVLVNLVLKFTCNFGDLETIGRITVFRDGICLGGQGSYGVQAIRSLQAGIKQQAVLTLMDDPEPGAHLYTVWIKVASLVDTPDNRDQRKPTITLEGETKQLACIRLPEEAVAGPARCKGKTTIDLDKWQPISGLSTEIKVEKEDHKVLVNFYSCFSPTQMNYDASYTIIRTTAGAKTNLGDTEFGMKSVVCDDAVSQENPAGVIVDEPGVGTHKYTVMARTRQCMRLPEAPDVIKAQRIGPPMLELGPFGQIAATLLETK